MGKIKNAVVTPSDNTMPSTWGNGLYSSISHFSLTALLITGEDEWYIPMILWEESYITYMLLFLIHCYYFKNSAKQVTGAALHWFHVHLFFSCSAECITYNSGGWRLATPCGRCYPDSNATEGKVLWLLQRDEINTQFDFLWPAQKPNPRLHIPQQSTSRSKP